MIKTYTYQTQGTCSREMTIEYDSDNLTLVNLSVYGGCNGNLKGISSLVKGMKLSEIKDRLSGIKCGMKSTSCPDQLSIAVSKILEAEK